MDSEQELEEILDSINAYIKELFKLGKWMLEAHSNLYPYDLFCTAILNRTVNFHKAYISMLKDNNFIAAAPLVRIHMDSLLRLFASRLIDYNVDEFANKVLNGIRIKDLTDRNKKKMFDGHLVGELSKLPDMAWVKGIYDQGSGYVHFSNLVTQQSFSIASEKSSLNARIRMNDDLVPMEEKITASITMMKISNKIAEFIMDWVEQKRSYNQETEPNAKI